MAVNAALCLVCNGIQDGRVLRCNHCKEIFHFPTCGVVPRKIDQQNSAVSWRDGDGLSPRTGRVVELTDQAVCGLCGMWDDEKISRLRTNVVSMNFPPKGRRLSDIPGEVSNQKREVSTSVTKQPTKKTRKRDKKKAKSSTGVLQARTESAYKKFHSIEDRIATVRASIEALKIGLEREAVILTQPQLKALSTMLESHLKTQLANAEKLQQTLPSQSPDIELSRESISEKRKAETRKTKLMELERQMNHTRYALDLSQRALPDTPIRIPKFALRMLLKRNGLELRQLINHYHQLKLRNNLSSSKVRR